MHLDKAIITNSTWRESIGETSKNLIHPGETSVSIRNNEGKPSKIIRISSSFDSMNVVIEYKEEVPNSYSIRG